MKVLIPILIGLLVVGCGKQEQTDTNESTPTTNTNKVNGTTANPVKVLTAEENKVVGTYEIKKGESLMHSGGVQELWECMKIRIVLVLGVNRKMERLGK